MSTNKNFLIQKLVKLNDIFLKYTNYKFINSINKKNLRQKVDGLTLSDILEYRFNYSNKYTSKDNIVSHINYTNDKQLTRQSFDSKENNLDIDVYKSLFKQIYLHLYDFNKKHVKLLAFDGTYNLNYKYEQKLSVYAYDTTNYLPIYLINNGKKNNEIKLAPSLIKENIDDLKNSKYILIFDRGYCSYEFMNFLMNNNIKFIIRCRNNCKKQNTFDYRLITKDIMSKKTYVKSIKEKKVYEILINDKLKLMTNVSKDTSNKLISNMYKNRWEIEIFFKLIKANFKFEYISEHMDVNIQKTYYSNLIIFYVCQYLRNICSCSEASKDINFSNLVYGIFTENIIKKIVNGQLSKELINNFCNKYNKKVSNKQNRYFERKSCLPFTKWYVKSYSTNAVLKKIINAFTTDNLSNLNKNEKLIYNKIIHIISNKEFIHKKIVNL